MSAPVLREIERKRDIEEHTLRKRQREGERGIQRERERERERGENIMQGQTCEGIIYNKSNVWFPACVYLFIILYKVWIIINQGHDYQRNNTMHLYSQGYTHN